MNRFSLTKITRKVVKDLILIVDMYNLNYHYIRDSLVAQLVKNPPATQETRVGFLGRQDELKNG